MEMLSTTKKFITLLLAITFFSCIAVNAGPPLPVHNVEGNSGAFITPTAYLVNPPEEGNTFGKPSFSFSYAAIGEKDFESVVVTENIWGRAELGYALERLGLGDWPDDVRTTTGIRVEDVVLMHNLNTRYMVIEEGGFDYAWMPAVTLGAHFKWNEGMKDINRQTNELCKMLGYDDNSGIELTAVATKTISNWLPRPIIISFGLRNGDAIHTGLAGFADKRRTTIEGSIIYFLTDKLLIVTEYRQKTDHLHQCTMGGRHLIKAENDWYDLCLGYVVNDHLTIAGGYANFGNVLNHREENVWAIQFKYEQ